MGTGWRRAFCTLAPGDPETAVAGKPQSPTHRSRLSMGLFSGGNSSSNPSTPRLQSLQGSSGDPQLRCRTDAAETAPAADVSGTATVSPKLQCKTKAAGSPRLSQSSNPNSPRSPYRFSFFKNSLRLSRNNCGICLQSIKTGQGTAIFTAECAHSFHFPCIAAQVRKEGALVCPVCNTAWKDAPLLSPHQQPSPSPPAEEGCAKQSSVAEKKMPRSDFKLYDDDEPLVSPRGAKFNTIPETEEEGRDEAVEFQGFFADPSKATFQQEDVLDSRKVEMVLLPEAAMVSVSRGYEGYAFVLKVKAPPPAQASANLDSARRAPIDLVTVLDVSGSMTGAKLQMLKRAMRLVVGSLGSSDRLSIVAFAASAKRLMPLTRMSASGQSAARRIIDRLACSQGTCVGDALRKATKVLDDRRERNPVASVMLLSDGQEQQQRSTQERNGGRLPSLQRSSTRFTHLEIPVHAFGFGAEQRPHLPEVAFAKCVGGLLSVVVQDLRLQMGFSAGAAAGSAEVAAVYSVGGRPSFVGESTTRLGDLYAGEERELLLEVRVPPAAAGAYHVMTVNFSYRDPATQAVVHCGDQPFLLPRPSPLRSSDPKVERLRNLFLAIKAAADARVQPDRACALHMLSSARELLLHSSRVAADEEIRVLDAEIAALHCKRVHTPQQIQRRRIQDHEESGEPLTPTSAWRAAEQLAKVAIMRKSLNRVSDLHGFENARF